MIGVEIVRITAENYPLFDAMVRWRMSGVPQEPTLYVNVENPGAGRLYEACGYGMSGAPQFMEKEIL